MGILIDKEGRLNIVRLFGLVVLIIVGIFTLAGTIAIVPAGYRGVVLQFGAVENRVLPEGLHFITPYVESYRTMEVRTQKYEVPCESASKDLLDVRTTVAINYHIDPAMVNIIYQKLSENYQERVIAPQVQEVVKSVTAKYDAQGLIQTRENVKQDIDTLLKSRMLERDIIIETISITNFEFPSDFNNAITSKQTQVQKAQEAENKVKEIQAVAQQAIAQAEGQAKAIQIINDQLRNSPDYLKWLSIQKWNGVLPLFLGNGATPFIDLQGLQASQAPTNSTGG
jgi:regulator of protease activity HflC (stomatin/prohibitin superfamily)